MKKSFLEQKGHKKESFGCKIPNKQDNHGEVSIKIEKIKYGMVWLPKKAIDCLPHD